MVEIDDRIKKPYGKDKFNDKKLVELMRCVDDPIFFTNEFVKIQHPTQGAIPFKLFDYQSEMISGFNEHRFCIVIAARQMGKCLVYNTNISLDKKQIKIGEIIKIKGLKIKIIQWLENILIRLAL